jgi:PadR family transcriptional regulator PadR
VLIGRMIHGSAVRRVSGIGWIQDCEAGNPAHACRAIQTAVTYVAMTAIDTRMLDRELKKGSAELIILSIVEPRARHGYEISKLIETRSAGQLKFHVASLYPLLYRLEERGWLQGRWVEKSGQRRRRFYSLTSEGRRVLARQRDTWKTFVHAMGLITGVDHA